MIYLSYYRKQGYMCKVLPRSCVYVTSFYYYSSKLSEEADKEPKGDQ